MSTNMAEMLRVGIIQTTVDSDIAWKCMGILKEKMNPESESMVLEEIRRGFMDFYALGESAPRIVIIPEYSIPHSGVKLVERYAKAIDAVVIGGCDLFAGGGYAQNKGVILIPNLWPKLEPATSCVRKYFGKKYFSRRELKWFNTVKLTPKPEIVNYIINAGVYGNIGIAICADFYDIERFVLYKGHIHHLFIIAYNIDKNSFGVLAEAISRLLFCNVVICNTGHYGDSLAYSPYSKDFRRVIFKASGAKLYAAQTIELPVRKLDEEQSEAHKFFSKAATKNSSIEKPVFKWPPGYNK